MDRTSDDVVRGKFFRVCVELDLSQPLVPTILALGRVFHVEYEGLPKICCKCGVYGHREEDCSSLQTAPPDSTSSHSSHKKSSMGLTLANLYGPWMLPAHVRRRQELQRQEMS